MILMIVFLSLPPQIKKCFGAILHADLVVAMFWEIPGFAGCPMLPYRRLTKYEDMENTVYIYTY